MSRWLQWLCDLQQIRPGADQPLLIEWHAPYARWILFAAGVLLAWVVVSVHRHESGPWPRRGVLAGLRCMVVALVVAVLCQPMLVYQRNHVERATVPVLVDTSSSMSLNDAYVNADLAETVRTAAGLDSTSQLEELSRLDLARRALLADDGRALKTLAKSNVVEVAAFSAASRPIAQMASNDEWAPVATGLEAVRADGDGTRLGGVLDDLFRSGDRLAAVVVVSDGQLTESGGIADVVDLARARQVPIYVVPVGSPRPRCDVAIEQVVVDHEVFSGDLVSVRVRLSATGLEARRELGVRLYDERDERLLTTERVVLGGDVNRADIELVANPTGSGRLLARVEIDAVEAETELRNNIGRAEVSVLDQNLRVLYVEGYPRFEYRYLKNALLRENSIKLSCLLLSADEDFAQEGADAVRRFPDTTDEIDQFDVVLLGDVDLASEWITAAQMQLLVDFVGRHGGGFGLIAGERAAPRCFLGTPLERLVPVQIEADPGAATSNVAEFHPRLTDAGRASRIFRFDRFRSASQAIFEALPGLYWTQRTRGPKPGAEVLLEHPSMHSRNGAMPLVVLGRFGAGRTFFQATDDTWRWRRHTGELVHDAYWVQVIRALAPSQDAGQDRRIDLTVDRPVCRFGDSVEVQLQVHDPEVLGVLGDRTELSVVDDAGFVVQKLRLQRVGEQSNLYEGSVLPDRTGEFALSVDGLPPLPGMRPVRTALRVSASDVETLHPEADYDALRRLAEGSGGAVVRLNQLDEALARIQDRSLQIPDDVTEPLWDTKLVLILFSGLIGTEWVLRKVFGLL